MRKSITRRSIDTLRDDELLALLTIARLYHPYTIIAHAFEEFKKVNPKIKFFKKHTKKF